ncbi:MAG: deoxyribodipyrimidine photo-lyase [Bacteroidales bacterium]|jgi:deoxyribodipyrimidine photo-lyase
MQKIPVFWFRRDLRLEDNRSLQEALLGLFPVLPLFIFDENIIAGLEADDSRVTFIHQTLLSLSRSVKRSSDHSSGGLYCTKGIPLEVWKKLLEQFSIGAVYASEDYEPYAMERDREIESLLASRGIPFHLFKDQVIFAKNDVLKNDNTPYTVFTPYKNKWIGKLHEEPVRFLQVPLPDHFAGLSFPFPSLEELGFKRSVIKVPEYDLDNLDNYQKIRNYPDVVGSNFRKKFDALDWINDPQDFEKWQQGQTGFPLVDAGMRELNATGYVHNRVRMIVAGFLCKDLLIDWRWGEAYFAQKLLDYKISSNNGNWQWAAGTGCDAVPYFRIFNPTEQLRKYDPQQVYIRKWIPELDTPDYPAPMVDHKMARERFIHGAQNLATQ